MSIGILERAAVSPTRDGMHQQSGDWESPAGLVESGVQARVQPPSLTYHGLGDEHWLPGKRPVVDARTDCAARAATSLNRNEAPSAAH